MRKMIVFLCLAVAALGAIPSAQASVTKSIAVPTGFTGTEANCLPNAAGCEKTAVSRHARCAYLADPVNSQGVVGYTVNVSGGTTYSLTAANATLGDFDVTFYQKLGTCSGYVISRNTPAGPVTIGENPLPATADRTDGWDDHTFGNESGTVPTGATKAIITLVGAPNQTFTWTN